ncbi:hypothetical protein N7462_000009 [Penicillium macrosclerotiorum]|uniref:uncharacterized protein n=1 Tax=Penicillium macrosclerotiorum TaxID=303699 RepID=UPI0025472500|nr:uncharacterized protein N7462_000009 [Penicillium macrosclerotiorum]KAJ5698004.1 hypothetical protein N7462_000009 [Penicillium macrosclerotiorum]
MSLSIQSVMDQRLSEYTPEQCENGSSNDSIRLFLRSFFSVLPSEGQKKLAQDAVDCEDDGALRQLVDSIRTGLIYPLRAAGGKTPGEVTPSPREGVEDSIEDLRSLIVLPITRGVQSRLRDHCLERDGNRCTITRVYSFTHDPPSDVMSGTLQAAHIIPFTLGSYDQGNRDAEYRNSAIWINLRRYFPVLHAMSQDRQLINHESNMLMLTLEAHAQFGAFRIVLEATSVIHQYHVHAFPNAARTPMRDVPADGLIRLRNHTGRWPLPNPDLLRVHASIGHFLHMTGMAETLDKMLSDYDDCGGLAPSGSTNVGELLALRGLSIITPNRPYAQSDEPSKADPESSSRPENLRETSP